METLATQDEIDWARTYDAWTRLAATPETLWSLVSEAHRELVGAGTVPEWCGVDLLRGWAFLAVDELRPAEMAPLGQHWLELLDAIRAHPGSSLADLPPVRSD